MPRYAALLRGVMPQNATMAALREAFEAAGFTDVKTVLASGNVLFTARAGSEASLERKVETAVLDRLGHTFHTIIRPVDTLRKLLAADPYRKFRVKPGAKRVVTFLRERPGTKPALPVARDGARILVLEGREAYTVYERTPKGPVFMVLIEQTFGKNQTTRTWETVAKLAR